MHRFYLPIGIEHGATVAFSAEQSAQIVRVLRLQRGERVEVFDGHGTVARVALTALSPRGAAGIVEQTEHVPWPLAVQPLLYLALIRPQRFAWAVEKAVELGARVIQPLVTTRTQHGDQEIGAAKLARWRAIATEAAEQCGSAYVPEVRGPETFAEGLRRPAALRLLPHTSPAEERGTIAGAVADVTLPAGALVAIYIGPEGGFTTEEVALARAAGCRIVGLGPFVQRSETAALSALAQLVAALEQR
jgi:16S rRNA (uracil1498-N3)-methyltransferase